MNKPILIFTVADRNNFEYARLMLNSLVKFHLPSENVDILLITDETDKTKLDSLPKNIILEDLKVYTANDPIFFYRQKPIVAENYMDQYELVLGLDADQIITGSLDYIFDTKDYDVGTVINWNRHDPQIYGFVQFQGIQPVEYFNCGLVAMRSKKFVHEWKVNCFTPQFERNQYKEQDQLNAMCYYGNWNVRCFDHTDGVKKYYAWHGLISKGEWGRLELRDGVLVVPKGEGDTPFPPEDMAIKVLHFGGGNTPNKMNYRLYMKDEISAYLDTLVSNEK